MQLRKRLAVFQIELMDEEGLRLLQNIFQAFDFFDLTSIGLSVLSKCVMLWLIKSENKFQSALLRLNSWGADGEVTSFGVRFLGVVVAVLLIVDNEISIGKWSLP
ncbi:hypothetical protein QTP88_019331 [Uroleucon formosanum]